MSKSNKINCHICNKEFKSITFSHVKTHGLTLGEYYILFGGPNGQHKRCSHIHHYTKHHCELHVVPDSGESVCILHVRDENKNKKLFNVILTKWIKYCSSKNSELHLEDVVFVGNVSLNRKEFAQNVYFNDSKFTGKTNFNNSKFIKEVNFRSCEFREVHFNSTRFNEKTLFFSAIFYDIAIFQFTNFNATSNYIYFVNVRFLKPDQVIFMENFFSKVLFSGTNLDKINIINAKWPQKSRLGRDRFITESEQYLSEIFKYKIEILYFQNLKTLNISEKIYETLKGYKKKEFNKKKDLIRFLNEILDDDLTKNDLKQIVKHSNAKNFEIDKMYSTYRADA